MKLKKKMNGLTKLEKTLKIIIKLQNKFQGQQIRKANRLDSPQLKINQKKFQKDLLLNLSNKEKPLRQS